MSFKPDYAPAKVRPSPNFGARRGCERPTLLLLHYTGMASGEGAEDWLCTEASQVSSHYLVHEDGAVVQMVREADRAWHAGRSSWHGETDINSHSIGVEIVNGGHAFGLPPFPDIQIEAVIALCRDVMTRHEIEPSGVLAHSDVAPGRKTDPGERFPWARLAEAGVGIFADIPESAATMPMEDLRHALERAGYEVGAAEDHARLRVVIEAFQRRYEPSRIDGIAYASLGARLSDLAKPSPVSSSSA